MGKNKNLIKSVPGTAGAITAATTKTAGGRRISLSRNAVVN